jgi:hypothetical protein
MFSMPVLDVAIGLSFIFLLLALMCTTLTEFLSGARKTRAKFLQKGIDRLLAGSAELDGQLKSHPLIRSLASKEGAFPSYIPAAAFATALLDILSGTEPLTNMTAVRATQAGSVQFQTTIKALVDVSPNAAALQKNVEEWFNSGMDRVSGWYKRNSQLNVLLMACVITLAMNADTVYIARLLWSNPAMREALVDRAKAQSSKAAQASEEGGLADYPNPNDAKKSKPNKSPDSPPLTDADQKLLSQVTGWEKDLDDLRSNPPRTTIGGIVWEHWIGWIITALAVSLGAPFWFDTLNRFMNIRNAGRAPDEPRDKSGSPPVVASPPPAPPQPLNG